MGSWRKSGMEILQHHLFWYVLLVMAYFFSFTESISRRDFPAGFIFGGASSAYQVYMSLQSHYYFTCFLHQFSTFLYSFYVWGSLNFYWKYEGAAFQHGKGPSIWDTFTWEHPGLSLSLSHTRA